MRSAFFAGLLLIGLGVAAFSYQGVIWVTGREEVARIGPIEVQRTKEFPIPLAPILGGLAIAGGILLMAAGAKRTGANG